MKIRNKITLLFTLLVTAIVLILSISVYYFTSVERKEIFRKRLKTRAGNNVQVFDYFTDSSAAMLRRIDSGTLVILPQKTVIIYDTAGKILYRYQAENGAPLDIDTSLLKDAMQSGEEYFTVGQRDGIVLYYPRGKTELLIAVAAYDEDGWLRLSQ